MMAAVFHSFQPICVLSFNHIFNFILWLDCTKKCKESSLFTINKHVEEKQLLWLITVSCINISNVNATIMNNNKKIQRLKINDENKVKLKVKYINDASKCVK